jgi:hypothetical protein
MGLHAEVIDRLGGYSALADRLGLNPATVWRWQASGIPAIYWPEVVKLAKGRRIRVSLAALAEEKAKPKRRKRT